MQNPLVSILIPFKNTSEFLADCINSILLQTYTNWEVLAINDHSIDNSMLIMEEYAKKDTRIKVFHNKGKGIIEALRMAYTLSKGELITRMDADDLMFPTKLDTMKQNLMAKGKGHIAIGNVKYFCEGEIGNGYYKYEKWLNKLTLTGSNFTEIYKECPIPSPCWMLHKSDLDRCGAFESNRYPEDYDLAFRCYEQKFICIPSDEILHYWRDYDYRASRTSEHYAQNYFLDIKLHYFLRLNYREHRPLVLWGAGKKGKEIARNLLERKIDFHWICNNPNKIGKDIYGQELLHFSTMTPMMEPQVIVTVANSEAQSFIHDHLKGLQLRPLKDYYFFC
ncbi:glycosyltransferase [Sediminicola sp. 1XM1-17]|uniref:glycosyltransferase n=1 Tax=Sediminicola sp. 1XM1-17 TaxID=3127702 RepID=UPI0030785A57